MFDKPILIFWVTAVLAVFTAAHPNLRFPHAKKGITTIPLRRRIGIRENGVFNYKKAVNSIVATRNKHRQNMINLERNRGREAFPEVRFFVTTNLI